MPNMIDTKRLFILADRQDAILDGKIFPREDQIDARMRQCVRHIDSSDARVRMRRAQKFAVRHSWQENVVGEARLAGHFRAAIDASARHTNYAKTLAV